MQGGTSTPHHVTFEKYGDKPPTHITILLHKHALLLAGSNLYNAHLHYFHHGAFREVLGLGVFEALTIQGNLIWLGHIGAHNGPNKATLTLGSRGEPTKHLV